MSLFQANQGDQTLSNGEILVQSIPRYDRLATLFYTFPTAGLVALRKHPRRGLMALTARKKDQKRQGPRALNGVKNNIAKGAPKNTKWLKRIHLAQKNLQKRPCPGFRPRVRSSKRRGEERTPVANLKEKAPVVSSSQIKCVWSYLSQIQMVYKQS